MPFLLLSPQPSLFLSIFAGWQSPDSLLFKAETSLIKVNSSAFFSFFLFFMGINIEIFKQLDVINLFNSTELPTWPLTSPGIGVNQASVTSMNSVPWIVLQI